MDDDDKKRITQDDIDAALADNAARSENEDEKQEVEEAQASSENSDSPNQSDSSDASDSSETSDSAVANEVETEEKVETAEDNQEEEIPLDLNPIVEEDAPRDEETQSAEGESGQSQDSQTTEPAKETNGQTPSDEKKGRWYVVHTYSGHEQKVAATLKQRIDSQKLKDKILDILVPTQEKIEIKEGKKSKVKEKIFPGYLLIRMVLDDITWLAVRTTPGITSFVGNAQKPTPLSQNEVETIKRFMSMEAPKFKTAFSKGEAVKIIEGPFAEFLGTVSDIDEEKGKLKVMVSIFGRETPVELDFLQVNKL